MINVSFKNYFIISLLLLSFIEMKSLERHINIEAKYNLNPKNLNNYSLANKKESSIYKNFAEEKTEEAGFKKWIKEHTLIFILSIVGVVVLIIVIIAVVICLVRYQTKYKDLQSKVNTISFKDDDGRGGETIEDEILE